MILTKQKGETSIIIKTRRTKSIENYDSRRLSKLCTSVIKRVSLKYLHST